MHHLQNKRIITNLPSVQQGLTLIELMISITLGLLLSFAATKLFVTGVNVYRVQTSVSDFQEAASYGLGSIENKMAMTNQGSYLPMSANSGWTGVVVTGSVAEKDANNNTTGFMVGNLRGAKLAGGGTLGAALLSVDGSQTTSGSGNTWTGVSNVKKSGSAIKSDQIVIQYRAPYNMKNCEGVTVTESGAKYDATLKTLVQSKVMVIERYYLKSVGGEIALMCDAGYYDASSVADRDVPADSYEIQSYGDAGKVMMKPVDHFRVLLAAKIANGVKYMSIKEYKDSYPEKPILGLQFGVIVKSKDKSTQDMAGVKYNLLDQKELTLNSNTKYLRRDFTSAIMFRNDMSDL